MSINDNWMPEQRHELLIALGRQADESMQDHEFIVRLKGMLELIGITPTRVGNYYLTIHDIIRLVLMSAIMHDIGGEE